MKFIVQHTAAILLSLTMVCVSVTIGNSQNATPAAQPIPQAQQQGIQGHEHSRATVTFSELVALEAAHPEIRANQRSPREIEFNHGDIIERKHGMNTSSNHEEKSIHHEKYNQPASPAPVTTFSGEDDNTGVEPPDVSGAVGPTYVVTTHNQDVKITSKTGATISTVALTTFWNPIGATVSSDPKIVYDPTTDRYIFVCLVNYTSAAPLIGIAVTATNNPNGTWYQFSIDVDSTGASFLDYPELGYNKNWVSVGGNYFTGNNFSGVGLFIIDKPDLINNTGIVYTKFTGSAYFDVQNDFCITAASIPDTTVNDLFILEDFDGTLGTLRQYNISGTPIHPVISTPHTIHTSFTWSGTGGANLGTQLNSTGPIDLDDDRISGSVVYRNGHLWVTHNAYLPESNPTRCSAHWMELDTMQNVIQDGMIDDPTGTNFYTYPAIAVASNGNAVIGYSNMGSTFYASCGYSFRAATDPLNTFRGNYRYKAGANTYDGGRWGDYSFACIDPVNDSTFWVVAEYAEATANTWGTWWAEINPVCITPFTPVGIIGPDFLCSTSLTNTYYSVVPVAGATSYTWTVSGTGWSAVNSTTDSILVTPGSGTGTITVTATNSCGSNDPQILTIHINNGAPSNPGSISGNITVCNGSNQTYSVTLDTTVSNYTWTLPNGWTGTSTTNIINTVVNNTNGAVMVDATNACGTSTWDSIIVSLPTAPVATGPVTINCGDSAVLTATGNAIVSWYANPSGGSVLDTGITYTTPSLNYNTTYYVENDLPGTTDYSTPVSDNFGQGGYNTFPHYEVFNVMSPCTLVSVLVYASNVGPRLISLMDASGNILDSVTINIPNGQSRITLNFPLAVGNGYELSCSGTPNLYRNSSGSNYPYSDPNGLVSITSNDVPDPARYYFFYDWELLAAPCGSSRIPVVVNVTGGVLAGFTYVQTGGTFTFTNTSIGGTSWLWNFGDTDTSTLQNPVHTYSSGGLHTVTLIAYNGNCSDTITLIDTIINTGINSPNINTSLNVYPDPVNDNLIINLNTLEQGKEWSIILYDVLGQTVLKTTMVTTTGSNQKQLDFSSIAKGIYTLELQNNGDRLIRKIVKD